MKTSVILLNLVMIICSNAFSQVDETQSEKTYHLRIGQFLPKYDLLTKSVTSDLELIKDTYYFNVIGEASEGYIVWMLEFNEKTEYEGALGADLNKILYIDELNTRPIYFFISKTVWDAEVIEIHKRKGITFGVTNIPFKVRFANTNPNHRPRTLDLDANVNLGISVARFWQLNEDNTYIFAATGFTISQFKIDATNTLDYVQQTENRSGFSCFLGLIFQTKDGLQLGLLTGTDYVAGEPSKYWVYQKKVWAGVGIGVTIFQPNNRPATSQAKKN
jgi:hypothetical protein